MNLKINAEGGACRGRTIAPDTAELSQRVCTLPAVTWELLSRTHLDRMIELGQFMLLPGITDFTSVKPGGGQKKKGLHFTFLVKPWCPF